MFEILIEFAITLLKVLAFVVIYVQLMVRTYYAINKWAKGMVVDNLNGFAFVVILPFFFAILIIGYIWDAIKHSILYISDRDYYVNCQRKNRFTIFDKFHNKETVHTNDN